MNYKELNAAQLAEYKFLKQQVDQRMDDAHRREAPADAAQRLAYAREELRQFVSARRAEGVNI